MFHDAKTADVSVAAPVRALCRPRRPERRPAPARRPLRRRRRLRRGRARVGAVPAIRVPRSAGSGLCRRALARLHGGTRVVAALRRAPSHGAPRALRSRRRARLGVGVFCRESRRGGRPETRRARRRVRQRVVRVGRAGGAVPGDLRALPRGRLRVLGPRASRLGRLREARRAPVAHRAPRRGGRVVWSRADAAATPRATRQGARRDGVVDLVFAVARRSIVLGRHRHEAIAGVAHAADRVPQAARRVGALLFDVARLRRACRRSGLRDPRGPGARRAGARLRRFDRGEPVAPRPAPALRRRVATRTPREKTAGQGGQDDDDDAEGRPRSSSCEEEELCRRRR
mmetsp:Transcript_17972/g.72048  ORF Transcript_17972/g.72048 Transcript_17972/m.72048 type:complete len:343 (-) Transcript_17972:398-1426(-)